MQLFSISVYFLKINIKCYFFGGCGDLLIITQALFGDLDKLLRWGCFLDMADAFYDHGAFYDRDGSFVSIT